MILLNEMYFNRMITNSGHLTSCWLPVSEEQQLVASNVEGIPSFLSSFREHHRVEFDRLHKFHVHSSERHGNRRGKIEFSPPNDKLTLSSLTVNQSINQSVQNATISTNHKGRSDCEGERYNFQLGVPYLRKT